MKRVVLVVAVLLMAACGSQAVAAGPPDINYGRDICIECGMIIDDPRFAAGYRLADGTERTFDDLGGLIIYGRETGELGTATTWVHDFETEEWLDATIAFYVPTIGVTSPMGHGILAFATEERAHRFAMDLEGEVIGWETVTELPVNDRLLGHHHAHEMDSGTDHDMEMEHEHDG